MAKLFLAYLQGYPFTVEATVEDGEVRGMEVQIPIEISDVAGDPSDGKDVFYIILPESLLDNCYIRPTPNSPTLRDHFVTEVLTRNLSIDGQGKEG